MMLSKPTLWLRRLPLLSTHGIKATRHSSVAYSKISTAINPSPTIKNARPNNIIYVKNMTMDSDFLPAQAPAEAQVHRINFAETVLPEYKNDFAAVIDNFLTPAECNELIRLVESSTITPDSTTPTWERAMVNMGNGKQALVVDTRNCGRIIFDSEDLAQRLLDRMMPFLRDFGLDVLDKVPLVTGLAGRNKTYNLSRLNERLRFLKYEGGEYFRPHWDGLYETPDKKEKSFFTIHLYLNGEGEQDLEELGRHKERVEREGKEGGEVNVDVGGTLLGGATSFLARYEEPDRQVRVFPRAGSVLIFQQRSLLHGGDQVFRGTKYTMRSDVMYHVE